MSYWHCVMPLVFLIWVLERTFVDSCHLCIVDATNHDRLAPVGCVGDLLVEGGAMSRGYINYCEKTVAGYI